LKLGAMVTKGGLDYSVHQKCMDFAQSEEAY
jgi:hypothetical protein